MSRNPAGADRSIATYCYQCVSGPDLLTVRIENGVATEVAPNFTAAEVHPAGGKVCVKAYGLIQKTYNPNRVRSPMKRTNPKKGRNEDPGFVAISWDEALDLVAGALLEARGKGLMDSSGYPRLAVSFGGAGTPTAYMGTFPALLAAWGPVDFGFGSGQGVKCYHSEHLYGEFWHRAFTVCPDTPLCEYLVSFGSNVEASGGVCGVKRNADARARGIKRVQVEPHLSVTGACSTEWIPIKPKTDAAFLYAMLHVMLHEHPRERLDLDFIKHRTSAPYLLGRFGYYMRDPETRKPLIWDALTDSPVPFDTPGAEPVLEAPFLVEKGLEIGADGQEWHHKPERCMSAFEKLVAHVEPYSPHWASKVCGVPVKTIRRVAIDFLEHARIGETIEIEGETLPLRPVCITLGKTVNNGWGGFDCVWARTTIACLVGALEVPGGMLGTTVRLNRPATSRQASVKVGPDGFMDYPMNPTDKEHWISRPEVRNANRTLIPLVANSPWSQALGPTHIAWMMQDNAPDHWPEPTVPDVWIVYRTNPAISFWETEKIEQTIARFPFTVAFAYSRNETNHYADVLLPECTDLESLQLIRIGGTKYFEQYWDKQGFALRQPAVTPHGEARDFTWITTELAKRLGLLAEYNHAIAKGAAGVPLKGEGYDFSLQPDASHSVEEIWDAICRAASAELSGGADNQGLDYYLEHGFRVAPFPKLDWYLYPSIIANELRFELPYQERLYRVGRQLANRLHERGISWWDSQLEEYDPLPIWKDYPGLFERALAENFDIDIDDFPFWLVTARSMQYAWGANVDIQVIKEVADNIAGHGGVVINARRAAELGISAGDRVEVRSPIASTRGFAVLRNGIRPDTLLMIGQFDHWATPVAKNFKVPSMNRLTPMLLDLTDATGSGSDLVKVALRRIGGPQ
ncbi:MAG: molybdopterin-dependent oxidoreductase [Rhodospirillales bacterium]|nr:molybdopterin-dependent oxidoreductase [Rhodospirillales bacterium]